MRFRLLSKKQISKLPTGPGVYALKRNINLFYIGKGRNIRKRVKNHFQQPSYRDNLFIDRVKKIGYIQTGSEIEALILEAELIRKYKPRYNILWRDDKNYFYVGITKEELPRVFITHQTRLGIGVREKRTEYVGPFVDGITLKKTLKVLRKVFPYYSYGKHPRSLCPWCHLGLCPGPTPQKSNYRKNVEKLRSILRGENKSVLRTLKKEMEGLSASQYYEKAALKRDQIVALEKTLAHARVIKDYLPSQMANWHKAQKELQRLLKSKKAIYRIEAFDVSNIQGQKATGAMVTFLKGKPEKNLYRRFRIKIEGKPNDIAMIKEILRRRFKHRKWGFSHLILIDGGKAQLNAADAVTKESRLEIPIIALAKRKNELFIWGRKKSILLKNLPREISDLILQLRDEAHRFALKYHQKLRRDALMR